MLKNNDPISINNEPIEDLYVDEEQDAEEEEEDEDELTKIFPPEVDDTRKRLKARHVLGLLGFLGFANVYAMRVNLSVAIVAMVNNTAFPPPLSNISNDHCPDPDHRNNTIIPASKGTFLWDEQTQGLVLGSFFVGYVLTQVPGGRFAEKYGGKKVFGFGVLLTALFTLLSPVAVNTSFPFFIVVRVLEGMSEGVTYPAMHAMLARWIPPLERSKFAAFVYAGSNFGTVVSLPISGWLCSLDFMDGWPLAFYIFGILGIVWFVFWIFFVFDTPAVHPRICRQERLFIQASVGPTEEDGSKTPWLKMVTCVPLWAILVTQCGQSWTFYTLLTELPTYLANILHLGLEEVSILSALPHLTSWWLGIPFSCFADWLLARGYLSLSTSYKLFNSISSIIPALGLLGVAWLGCNRIAVQVMLGVSCAFMGASYAGNQMNHIALSPRYAGTMYGMTNAASNVCGFLAPYVVGFVIYGRETLGQWRFVFYLAAGINIGTNLFYVAFASAREQPWSRSQRINSNLH